MAEALPGQQPTNQILNCRFCEKTFNSVINYVDHIRCRDHYKMVNISEKKSKAGLLQQFKDIEDSKMDRSFFCPECGTKFSSWTNADDHFRSSQHIKKISENEMELILYNMKHKMVPPITQNKQHLVSNALQIAAIHKTAHQGIDKKSEISKEAVDHDGKKMLNRDHRVRTELENTKMKVKVGEVSGATKFEDSSSRVKVRKGISDCELKRGASKCNNGKVISKKSNARNSKEQLEITNSDSISEDMPVNGLVRSTQGIAFFLPNDPTGFSQTYPLTDPASCKLFTKLNRVTITKKCNYQEDICISTISKAKGKNTSESAVRMSNTPKRTTNNYSRDLPGRFSFSVVPDAPAGIEMNHKGKNRKHNETQKHLSQLGTEISVIQREIPFRNNFARAKQNHSELSLLDTVKKPVKNRSCSSTDSNKGGFNNIEIFASVPPSNIVRRNYKAGLQKEAEGKDNCKEKTRTTSKSIKSTGVMPTTNKGRVNGQCENCGHVGLYNTGIMTNKNRNAIPEKPNLMVENSGLCVVSDKRKSRNLKANK